VGQSHLNLAVDTSALPVLELTLDVHHRFTQAAIAS
jgi:chloramphenicol 3-O-phosphotransferase